MEDTAWGSRLRPLSPNMQHYRPQLTSVLSILNRVTGVLLVVAAVGLVLWLAAAAAGPDAYAAARAAFVSWPAQVVLCACTFAFFLHLFGGIRHLVWDSVRGFELGSIYLSGWLVVAISIAMTAIAWIAAAFVGG